MTSLDPKLHALLGMAASTLRHELGCDDCFAYFAAYAEHLASGTPMPEPLELVAEHLERCAFCLEEFELLLQALSVGATPGAKTGEPMLP